MIISQPRGPCEIAEKGVYFFVIFGPIIHKNFRNGYRNEAIDLV
jgi:hypothetical protein